MSTGWLKEAVCHPEVDSPVNVTVASSWPVGGVQGPGVGSGVARRLVEPDAGDLARGESLANRTPRVKGTPSLKSGSPGVTVSWYSEQGQTPSGRGAGTVVKVHVPPRERLTRRRRGGQCGRVGGGCRQGADGVNVTLRGGCVIGGRARNLGGVRAGHGQLHAMPTAALDKVAETVASRATLEDPGSGACAPAMNGASGYWTTTSTR